MRYMYLVLCSPYIGPPPEKLIQAIHELVKAHKTSGAMIADGGLTPLSMGARVQLKGGKVVVLDGPFAETKEVIGGFAIFE